MAMKSERNRLCVESSSQNGCLEPYEIEKGRVGEVRQRFQIHEDEALAYKIQSQEIESHVSRNKKQRKTVRDNVKTAKQTYLEEVKNSGVLPETCVAEIERKQWLTEELQRRVEEQESATKAQAELQTRKDEEIASRVQHEEEMRQRFLEHKRLERLAKEEEEHRRLCRIMKELETANIGDNDNDEECKGEYRGKDFLVQLPETKEIITLADGTVIDAKHNEIQSEEQKKRYMERRDEELAKILQEQEDLQLEKQKNIHEDRRKAIELQDREIAKHLQRQEKAKAEKRREKMRRGQSLPEREEYMSAHRRRLPTYHQATGVGEMEEKEAYHLANSGYRSEPDVQSRSSEEREENISPRGIRRDDKHDNEWVPWDSDHKRNAAGATGGKNAEMNEYGAYYKNIAEVLDPTFQRAPHCSGVMLTDDHNDRQTGNKSAPIVPPLKRKSPKEKGKKGHR